MRKKRKRERARERKKTRKQISLAAENLYMLSFILRIRSMKIKIFVLSFSFQLFFLAQSCLNKCNFMRVVVMRNFYLIMWLECVENKF